ncbi:TMV resistance protein Y3 [Coprinopsis sp. MPI-PUGE-AT-0042]|nr:TMV resistance protein Y3 [Coprinopsis sp. MPI-PUGE-AT-0042]
MVFPRTTLLSVAVVALSVGNSLGQLGIACLPSSEFAANCSRFIDVFCDQAGTSRYNPNSISRCFNNGSSGTKCDLTAWLRTPSGSGPQTPSAVNCRNALRTVTNSCPSGGQGQFNNAPFQFSIDPNYGR